MEEFLRGPAGGPSAGNVFERGAVLNDTFEIGARIGEGGMGQIYEATDRLLHRKVAIKVATAGGDANSLRREAQALAAIRHPNVVGVHAVREHEGVAYVVMDRVFGTTLDARLVRLEAEPMKLPEILGILLGIAEGLTAVHKAGIAHRDINPRNVMLAKDRVVITDLGVFQPEAENISHVRTASGSPSHMGPEATNNAVAPGEAYLLDIYALGVIAYEMVTGELPFLADSVPDLMKLHRSAPVPDVKPRNDDVPDTLVRLVREMLAKRPAARPQSAEAVAWRLRSIGASTSRSGAPPSKP